MSSITTRLLGPFPEAPGYDEALDLDGRDALASFRRRFTIDDDNVIYLDGNSLGRRPKDVTAVLEDVADRQWSSRLIRSWNEGWWDLQLTIGDLIAGLIGAGTGEVIVSDSTSVNLHKLAGAAARARGGRRKIVTDDLNFPTDLYVLHRIAVDHDMHLEVIESDGVHGPVATILDAIDDQTALVSLSHTTYMSGHTYDMAQVNEAAHDSGALTLWDLSHSVGAMPIDLGGTGADLATGCTYKYLNGGPGSPAFLYVRRDLQPVLENPINAWWAHRAPFDMSLVFEPTDGIRRFHTGTMPILSLAASEPGIRTVIDAGVGEIRKKSVDLTTFFVGLHGTHLAPLGFEMATPADPDRRGSHVSLRHAEGWPITRALIDLGQVIPDFRAPDVIRFGFAPLYTTFAEVHTAVIRLKLLLEGGEHHNVSTARGAVT